jgi:Protein of unknown function (DUF3224)
VTHAKGSFEVTLTPQSQDGDASEVSLGRKSIEKRFHGDLEATGRGTMLTAVTGVQGSAGYVAIERIAGTLQGRSGSFVLMHRGVMTQGAPEQTVTIVPDSGTGQLAGIAGKMTGTITDGEHFYELEYTLPAP